MEEAAGIHMCEKKKGVGVIKESVRGSHGRLCLVHNCLALDVSLLMSRS